MWKDCCIKELSDPSSGGQLVIRHKTTGITLKNHVQSYRGEPSVIYLFSSGIGENWTVEIHVTWELMDSRAREAGEACDDADNFGACLDAFRIKYGESYYIRKVGGSESHGKVLWNKELVEILAMLFFIKREPWDDPDGKLKRLVKLEFCPADLQKKLYCTFSNLQLR